MKLAFNLAQKLLLLVGVLLVFELLFLASLAFLVQQSQREALIEAESKEIAGKICHVFRLMFEVSQSVDKLSKMATNEEGLPEGVDSQTADMFHKRSGAVQKELKVLSHSVIKYPIYKARIDRMTRMIRKALRITEVAMGLDPELSGPRRMAFLAVASKSFDPGTFEVRLLAEIDGILSDHKRTIAAASDAQRGLRGRIEFLLCLAVLADIAFAFTLGALFVNGITNRLAILSDNFARFAQGREMGRAFKTQDEIGQFDRSFRAMAATLKESARKERAIIENASDVICSLDKQGCFVKVNPACQFIWGYTPESLIGTALRDLVSDECRQEFTLNLSECFSAQRQEFEVKMLRQDGKPLHMLWSARWAEADQNLFCVAHDITERKLSEAQLLANEQRVRAMLDNMVVGLITAGQDGSIESLNARMEQISGFGASELTGQSVARLFSKLPTPASLELSLNQPGTPGASHEDEIRNKSAEPVPVEVSQTEFQTLDGQRLLINVLDISERHALERMRQEFIAMVSHDLRTPLTSVSLYLEMLESGVYAELSEAGSKCVVQAGRAAQTLLSLINDLLEITRLEAGKLELQLKPVSLKTLIENAIFSAEELARQKNVSIESQILDANFLADTSRLERVVSKLLANAIYSSPEGATVTVTASNLPAQVEIRVRDKGPLISDEQKSHIFDRMARTSMQRGSEQPASGLGLAIAKAIVEQHEGIIDIDSNAENGNTIWFTVPRQDKGEVSA